MLILWEATVDVVAPLYESSRCVDHWGSSPRLPRALGRLLNDLRALLRTIARLACAAGIAVVALLTAEVAHDLCLQVGFGPTGGTPMEEFRAEGYC